MIDRLRGTSSILLCLICLAAAAATLFGLTAPPAGFAQTAASALLAAPQIKSFPRIVTYLDVRDAQGKFLHGLQPADVQILEDGLPTPATHIAEMRPGVQFVAALNPGPAFAIRNSQAQTRYEFLVQTLADWAASRQGSTVDDWSLIITGGGETTHSPEPMAWLSALQSIQVDLKTAEPSLDTLAQAVEVAADPTPRPGMSRAVLFITPPLENELSVPLQNIAARAAEQGVRVFVWMVASRGTYPAVLEEQLTTFAVQTGGQLLAYTGEDPLPSPEAFLGPLRSIYQVEYVSQLKGSGDHQISAQITTDSGEITSPVQIFALEIHPPNPVFVQPVVEIRRSPAEEKDGTDAERPAEPQLLPAQQPIQVVVDFPDGRVRPLARTTLFVDGEAVATRTSPPFEQFNWDLRQYASSGPHILRVEAVDTLGMAGSSMDTVVQITVEMPPANPLAELNRQAPILAGLGILLVGAVTLLALVLSGRIRPYPSLSLPRLRPKSPPQAEPPADRPEPAPRRRPTWTDRLGWPQRHVDPLASAFLARISEGEGDLNATPLPITTDEITLGSDPNLATLVLNDATVEGLHARLMRMEPGVFRLADEGSIAGTWVNYTPVSSEGVYLEHNDLIHIGRLGFRFTLRQPIRVRRPIVTLLAPQKEAEA